MKFLLHLWSKGIRTTLLFCPYLEKCTVKTFYLFFVFSSMSYIFLNMIIEVIINLLDTEYVFKFTLLKNVLLMKQYLVQLSRTYCVLFLRINDVWRYLQFTKCNKNLRLNIKAVWEPKKKSTKNKFKLKGINSTFVKSNERRHSTIKRRPLNLVSSL